MKSAEKIFYLFLFIILPIVFLYTVSNILLPFVVAVIVAYFLDPAADALERIGISRMIATTIIIGAFFVILAVLIVLLSPIFYDQLVSMINKIPEYVHIINEKVIPSASHILERLDPNAIENAKSAVRDVSGYLFTFLGKMISNAWTSGMAFINLVSLIFITPIVAFYILRDWDEIVTKINSWLPKQHAPVIREQLIIMDKIIAGYLRGQANVCLLLGAFYAIALAIAGLDFAIFIGLATGILTFIPYVGAVFGFIIGIAVAFFQFGNVTDMAIIAAIFAAGQFLEGNFVSPKMIGDKVGLHPVWIMFGMLAGASLFGLVGVLIAVPVTAVIGVLIRFAIDKYLKSEVYNGTKTVRKKKAA